MVKALNKVTVLLFTLLTLPFASISASISIPSPSSDPLSNSFLEPRPISEQDNMDDDKDLVAPLRAMLLDRRLIKDTKNNLVLENIKNINNRLIIFNLLELKPSFKKVNCKKAFNLDILPSGCIDTEHRVICTVINKADLRCTPQY